MRQNILGTIVVSATVFHSYVLFADVISEQLIQADGPETFALGQSLMTPAGGPWNNLTFNWFDSASNPIATGTLFLLNQEYLGTPGALGTATPGYIAQSQSIAGGMYIFAPDISIQPTTMYFYYTNQTVPNNTGDGNVITGSAYADVGNGGTYISAPGEFDARFRLQGSVVPEPCSLAICLSAFFIVFVNRRARV
jgi:hypothetical protein